VINYRSLLNREISEYPVNIIQSTDPNYYPEYKRMIVFDVNISEYRNMISQSMDKAFNIYNVGVQESGQSTAKDLILKIRTKIMQLYKIKVTTHDKKKGLAIKFEGYSDYLLGKYKLKDYKRICNELGKELIVIKIMLTEIPVDLKDKNFPPLYFMPRGSKFDYKLLKDSSFMYLYPPKKQNKKVVESLHEMPKLKSK
jgi:hypothetical protein